MLVDVYSIIYYLTPAALVVLSGIGLGRWLYAIAKNKKQPGAYDETAMKKRRQFFFICLACLGGLAGMLLVGGILLYLLLIVADTVFGPISFM